MSSYAYRFVGQESLPSRLPDFDLEQFFQLTEADVAAVTDRFGAGRRVAGALEIQGRLRRANERVTEFQGRIPLAGHWGTGEKTSADMMSLDVSRHL